MSSTPGQSDAADVEVARWCAANRYVIVSCDSDFRGRSARTRALTSLGVEAIVFTYDLVGL